MSWRRSATRSTRPTRGSWPDTIGPGRDPGHEQEEERLGRKAAPFGEPDQERRPDHSDRVLRHEGRERREDTPVDRRHGPVRRDPTRRNHDEGDGPARECPAADPPDGQQGSGHDPDGERRDERHNGQIATAIILTV